MSHMGFGITTLGFVAGAAASAAFFACLLGDAADERAGGDGGRREQTVAAASNAALLTKDACIVPTCRRATSRRHVPRLRPVFLSCLTSLSCLSPRLPAAAISSFAHLSATLPLCRYLPAFSVFLDGRSANRLFCNERPVTFGHDGCNGLSLLYRRAWWRSGSRGTGGRRGVVARRRWQAAL